MMNSNGGMSPADYAAVMGNNNSGSPFGGDGAWWIIILLLFGWGRNGNGGLGGGGGSDGVSAGFAWQGIDNGIRGIQQGICDSTYALNNTMMTGFHGVDRGLCEVSHQISDCCCTTKQAIADVKYTIGQEACETRHAIYNNTRDIIDNQNANSRAILDFLVQEKLASKDARIAELTGQLGRAEQNGVIGARIDAAVAEILRRTGAECPSPAYLVNAPTPVSFPVNGCGQVQFGYGGCGGCGNGYAA